MNTELGMPKQCIDTGRAFVKTYGKERALETTQRNHDTIYEAYELIKGKNTEELNVKSKLGSQAQFWREVNDSIKSDKLGLEFFEILDVTPDKETVHS